MVLLAMWKCAIAALYLHDMGWSAVAVQLPRSSHGNNCSTRACGSAATVCEVSKERCSGQPRCTLWGRCLHLSMMLLYLQIPAGVESTV
jgi:hypothetical protein